MSSAAALIMASQQHEPGVANRMYQEEQQHLRRASADNLLAGSGVEGSGHDDKLEMKQRSMSTPATPKQGELIMGLAHGPTDAPMMMMPGKVGFFAICAFHNHAKVIRKLDLGMLMKYCIYFS